MIKNYFLIIFLLALVLIVFNAWFSTGAIVGGDLSFKYQDSFINYFLTPFAWQWSNNSGFGGFNAPFLGIHYKSILINLLGLRLGLSWEIIVRVSRLFPFLFLSLFSSIYIFRKIFPKNKFWFLAPLIFVFNPYILMVVGGGQIGISLAYAVSPLILYFYTKFLNNLGYNPKKIILAGLLLSVQVMFDVRITYLTLFAVGIYWIISVFLNRNKNYIFKSLFFVSLTFFVAGLIHAFWLLPTLFFHQNPLQQLGSAYTTEEAVRFFSFAKFENTISLLHPNWPENIFGKVGFMKAEFLLLPILAFSSLFFVKKEAKEKRKYILFFSIISLLGAFLAKGANEPFGGIYLWMFNYVPGFIMFRDPTKFYLLIAISYSILIPFTISKVYELLKSRTQFSIFPPKADQPRAGNFSRQLRDPAAAGQFSIKSKIFNFQNVFLFSVLCFMLFLIRPALMGQLTGTFKTTTVPNDYIKLEKYISSQNGFFRVLWIPTTQAFTFNSINHPAVNSENYFKTTDYPQILKKLRTPETEKLLQESGVKYVIVPYDSEGKIFLKDRKYDNKAYLETIKDLKSIFWLKSIPNNGKIVVYKIPGSKDHFWSTDEDLEISYKFINPSKYSVSVSNAKKGDKLVFAENFDPNWVARNKSMKYEVSSIKYEDRLNSFVLPRDGSYSFEVYYKPQDWVNIGLVVSGVSMVVIIILLIKLKR